MIDGTYTLAIDTPFGRKPGTAELRTVGDKVQGVIDAPMVGKQRLEGRAEGEDAFSAAGTLKIMLMGKVTYDLRGKVEGDSIRITIQSSKGDFELEGTRVR